MLIYFKTCIKNSGWDNFIVRNSQDVKKACASRNHSTANLFSSWTLNDLYHKRSGALLYIYIHLYIYRHIQTYTHVIYNIYIYIHYIHTYIYIYNNIYTYVLLVMKIEARATKKTVSQLVSTAPLFCKENLK